MVNKTTIKKLMLSALALLTVGSMNAATETYDFTGKTNNSAPINQTSGNEVTVNAVSMWKLALEGENFGNRFAVGPTTRTGTGGFCFKNYNSEQGLYSQYDSRNFAILNLKEGDKVTLTFTIAGEGGTLKFVGTPNLSGVAEGATVTSDQQYTVSAKGNLMMITGKASADPKVYITKVVIETATATEAIHIGKKTEYYNFESIAKSTAIDKDDSEKEKLDPLSVGGNTFNGRFSTQQANCFQVSGSGWGFQINYNKWFAINNLKAGDQFMVKFKVENSQVPEFDDPTLVGQADDNKTIVSEQWYTLAKDATQLKIVNTVNTNGYKTDYLNITIISTDETITAGTLVSTSPLDFSSVSGLTAYVATAANNGTVTFSPVTKVASATPVYLMADNAGIYDVPVLNGEAETITTNLLKGSATASASLTSTDDTKYYVFGVKDGEAGFYPVGTSSALTSAAGKAYLELTAAQAAAASRIVIVFADNETTGIHPIDNGQLIMDNCVYDLQGRKVGGANSCLASDQRSSAQFSILNSQLKKGLYIVNGKKIFVK